MPTHFPFLSLPKATLSSHLSFLPSILDNLVLSFCSIFFFFFLKEVFLPFPFLFPDLYQCRCGCAAHKWPEFQHASLPLPTLIPVSFLHIACLLPLLPILLISSHSSDLQRRGCWHSVHSWPSWRARWLRRWSAATHPAPKVNQKAAFGSCWWSHSHRESPAVPPLSWRRSRGLDTCRSYITHTKQVDND